MSEETTTHSPGDVVWVKISTTSNKECWWPGEVVDFESLSDEVRESFYYDEKRTPPLVTVAFFGETSYEFIKDNDHVYAYNCTRKDDFITRGLDAYRRSKSFMEKFPKDIRTAETKTNGNVKILDDPKYSHTQQKFNYNLIFSGSAKKTEKRKSLKSSASSGNSPQKSNAKRRVVNITHPRFLGLDDDCQVRVLVQQPMTKDPEEEEKKYTCPKCDYVTSRIDVFVFHSNSHGVKTSSPKGSKIVKRLPNKRVSKIKIPPSRTTTIDEDLALLQQGLSLSYGESSFEEDDDVENRPKPKQKRKMKTGDKPKGKKKKVEKEAPVEKKTDVHELTAEWEEEDEEVEEEKVEAEADKASTSKLDDTAKKDSAAAAADDTCFDFNEDEEDKIMTPSTPASGRKIPRVIPEKRKSFEPTDEPPATEDDKPVETVKPTEVDKPVDNTKPSEDEKSTNDDMEAFNEILEATKLPEIPQSLKCEQNFHNTRAIKFPDKQESPPTVEPEPSKSEPPKLINIKKRFVRSFEEMERKELEAKNDDLSKEHETVVAEETKIIQNEEEAKAKIVPNEEEEKTNVSRNVEEETTNVTKNVEEEKTNVTRNVEEEKTNISQNVDEEKPKVEDSNLLLSNGKESVESPKTIEAPEVIEETVVVKDQEVLEDKLDDCNNISNDIKVDVVMEKNDVVVETKKEEHDNVAPAEKENDCAKPVEADNSVVGKSVKPKWKSRLLSADKEDVNDKSSKNKGEAKQSNEDEESVHVKSTKEKEERCSKKRRASLKTARKSVDVPDAKKHDEKLKVSKLKTQLMSKLSEGEPDVAISASRSRNRSRSDADAEPTAKKPRRVSHHFEEIVIEKSVDKVEVTVNKEAEDKPSPVEPPETVAETVQVEMQEVEATVPEAVEETTVVEEVKVEETERPSALDTLAAVSGELEAPEINIEKNLTVVSESDLGDKEVEIAKIPIVEEGTVKATTIAGFSVDFGGDDRDNKDGLITAAVCEEIESPQFEVHVSETVAAVKIEPEILDTEIKQEPIVEVKKEEEVPNNSVEVQMAHLTNTSMEAPIKQEDLHETTTSKRLLEILTEPKTKRPAPKASASSSVTMQLKIKNPKFDLEDKEQQRGSAKPKTKTGKVVVRSSIPGSHHKTTVVHESASALSNEITVQKVPPKSDDIEDIARYIIQKPVKSVAEEESEKTPTPPPPPLPTVKKPPVKSKPKILDNTIIKPPNKELVQKAHGDDNVFDIDSMPIVLGDQILTPETIENMPIVLQDSAPSPSTSEKAVPHIRKVPQSQLKLVGKPSSPVVKESPVKPPASKTYSKVIKQGGKVYQASGTTLLKANPAMLSHAKSNKFVIVSSESATPTSSKYVISKRIVKRTPGTPTPSPSGKAVQESGNKIMIVTNHKGQQQMVLAPTQKIVGYQTAKKVPTIRGSGVQGSKTTNIISQTIINPKGQITTTSPFASAKKVKIDPAKSRLLGSKVIVQGQGGSRAAGQPRTIIIRNPQGQTVKKIHTDEALLDQQVQEQLDAIKRSTYSQNAVKMPVKKYSKKINESTKVALQSKAQTGTSSAKANVPPLAPISPAKKVETKVEKVEKPPPEQKRAPHQLVIQDALGNQTTITEGQILALPSETVDGQPQSYMLVTLDETGNLTPLNNEALMSLDPNICGDLSNMVLHVDQGSVSAEAKPSETPQKIEEPVKEEPVVEEKPQEVEVATSASDSNAVQAVACAINNGETNQQLIITGDPVSTQKFLESLSEGNADLANLLANAEGNILIHADGQQILINTDADNQMMLAVNSDGTTAATEPSESTSNPVFSSQAPKNQDILAAALADTDVFQQEQAVVPSSKVTQSQLSPGGPLYPINVNNVLETSSMSSPIMTPLEVPSSNGKKIECEAADILSSVPKNVDLPITITDPNISQTVSQQQVALISNELHANLELPLGIQDVTVTSAEMNSPSFGYLDDSVDKSFSGSISMPLLTEEPEDAVTTSSVTVSATLPSEIIEKSSDDIAKSEPQSLIKQYLLATTGMPTMCSSLSEPPPDMFDFTVDQEKPADEKHDSSTPDINSPASTDSCEIPVQPEIVADISKSSPPDHVVDESSSPPSEL